MGLQHNHHHHEHGSMTAKAAIASVAMALFLTVLKSWAAVETGSVALLGSLADTGFDLLASLLTLFSVRYAALPADDDHRFGHGKAEALSALVQVMLVTVSALFIGWRAVVRFGDGAPTEHPEMGIGVSLVAIAATLGLLAYQRHVIKKTGSVAIHGDHLHYQGDLLLNIAVIVALALDAFLNVRGADPLFGIAIALWLLWGAWRAASLALDQLLDKEWPLEKRQRFIEVAMRHPELKGIHDMRTRSAGAHDFCQFHVWVDPNMTVLQAHEVMDEIEAELMREFPGVEVLIHPDPEGHKDELGYIPSETVEHQDDEHEHHHP
ncbi:cation diffusion facilitator family transporter [Sphingorhabdus sp.]|jgi:ferrous-iron efflux pump FieF|uniref:cation diffusion facilitator family transporter n=1 Tax=Sphingorhabdus sp. TaxID=1902408 RepID=UPI002C6322CA|nr:cation diffusion facilitator family transporter [Sphingorhabdus sp.]HMT41438.1 cation diffusion facilitator family transporter [Sphingorhabdus sp.]